MPNLNFLFSLNAYSDSKPSNAPSLSNFKWTRAVNGISISNPDSSAFSLAPGETKTLFNGTRALSQDNTTQYTLSLVPLTGNTYNLAWTGGVAPNFRTPRATSADATTQVTATVNGPLVTFASTGGTSFNLTGGGVVVGDYVRLGNLFNQENQGERKIISVTSTSFTVENELGVAEGPITLGSGFATQVQMYSAAGVQVGDTLVISGGFSLVTQASYKVTSVGANFLQFNSTDVLPQEGPVTTQVAIYSSAKQLVYLESDQHVSMIINSVSGNELKPLVVGSSTQPGVFIRTSTMYSMSVTNVSTDPANLTLISVE